MNVGIVAQRGNARAAYLAAELRETLRAMDVEVAVDTETAAAIDVQGIEPARMSGFDLIVSIGGDGTFLFSAREVGDTPIVGVNLGEVGFLNAVSPGNAIAAVRSMVEQYRDSGTIDERRVSRLAATGPGFTLDPAVNEVVVQGAQRGHGNGITVEVRVDGSLYTGGHADGVLVATPTGSTAYNLSEGGPLVSPGMDALVITEMCATESMPALVVDADSEVTIRVDDAPTAYAISDGRSRERFDPPGRIELSIDDTPLRIAGPESDFFEALGKLQ